MSSIHFQTTYPLSHQYHAIKSRAPEILGDFLADTSVYHFNDQEQTLTFTSERLIPTVTSGTKAGFAVVLQSTSAFHPAGDVSVAIGQGETEFFLDRDEGCWLVQAAGGESCS